MAIGDRRLSIEALFARYGLVAIFLGAGLEGETAVVTGGVLAHQGLVPLWGAMAVAVAGSFVADQLLFAGGRRFRDSAFIRRIRARPAFAKSIDLLERHPRSFIFAYRFVYGVRTVSPVAIGTSRISQRLFVGVNLIAALVWGCGFSAIGSRRGTGIAEFVDRIGLRRLLTIAGITLAVIVFAVLAWRKWRRLTA